MLFTRLGMDVTLCHPDGYELDPNVIEKCKENSEASGGQFKQVSDFERAFENQEIVYARHWSLKEQQYTINYDNWYLDEASFGRAEPSALFIHPMPLRRNDEVDEKVANGARSLLKFMPENKYYLQKAVFALSTGYEPLN